jgi:hypothetical protein
MAEMPSERQTLDEQRYIFEGFVELAHLLGASPLRDGDIRIVDAGDGRRVAWFFSHGEFPGMRFGYWAKTPGEDGHEVLWLAEELATGALLTQLGLPGSACTVSCYGAICNAESTLVGPSPTLRDDTAGGDVRARRPPSGGADNAPCLRLPVSEPSAVGSRPRSSGTPCRTARNPWRELISSFNSEDWRAATVPVWRRVSWTTTPRLGRR